jgi:hypothetical protein
MDTGSESLPDDIEELKAALIAARAEVASARAQRSDDQALIAHLKRQPPVRTASMSLTWRIAPEQVGIGFVDFDELSEIVDAEVCEGRYRLFARAEHDEATVFRVHFDADVMQPVLSSSPSISATRAMVKT